MEVIAEIAVWLIITAVWIAGGLATLAHLSGGVEEPRVHSPQARLIPTEKTDKPGLVLEQKS